MAPSSLRGGMERGRARGRNALGRRKEGRKEGAEEEEGGEAVALSPEPEPAGSWGRRESTAQSPPSSFPERSAQPPRQFPWYPRG